MSSELPVCYAHGMDVVSCFVRRDPPSSAKMKKRVSTGAADC